ncbi:MAG: DUF4097 family beta strand repeat protein [Clostridia bacterium]|nr:DUF4097 family beta strand repeat protein [Clostridia bacterium]
MKKGFIIAATVLIVIGAVLFVFAFRETGYDLKKLDATEYETNTYTLNEDYSSIKIKTYEADVVFTPSENGQTKVVLLESKKEKYDVLVENNTLTITAKDTREWYDHISFFSVKQAIVTVSIPLKAYNSLDISSGTGDVVLTNNFSTHTGKIKVSTGDINIKNIDAKSLDLSVSTGTINCKNVNCNEDIVSIVSTGQTNFTNTVCRTLKSKGSTGDIKLKNVVAKDCFSIKRSTGEVYFDNCDANEIEVKTSTGDVSGTLKTEKVFITKTSTGTVNVPKTISGGKCEITTSTGDIIIDIAK